MEARTTVEQATTEPRSRARSGTLAAAPRADYSDRGIVSWFELVLVSLRETNSLARRVRSLQVCSRVSSLAQQRDQRHRFSLIRHLSWSREACHCTDPAFDK